MEKILKTLIKNGRVFDGESFFYADVLTEGEKVVKIEPKISSEADFVYDASGKIARPERERIRLAFKTQSRRSDKSIG